MGLRHFRAAKKAQTITGQRVNLDWQQIEREFARYTHFLQQLSQEISASLQSTATPEIIVHGVAEVIRQPEFAQFRINIVTLALLSAKYRVNSR